MRTTDVAADMDRIRAALGADRLNFLGFSYGTYLGQVYATLFPGRVGRMVLDSNVDPQRAFYQANLDQDVAMQRVLNKWFRWVARKNGEFGLGRSAKSRRRAIRPHPGSTAAHPAGGRSDPPSGPTSSTRSPTRCSPGDPGPAVRQLPRDGEEQGPGAGVQGNVHVRRRQHYAVYNAVQCTDAPGRTSGRPGSGTIGPRTVMARTSRG